KENNPMCAACSLVRQGYAVEVLQGGVYPISVTGNGCGGRFGSLLDATICLDGCAVMEIN
ncbi:hypothetical protein LCGC14_1713110, partial [marine sediment metagenome]